MSGSVDAEAALDDQRRASLSSATGGAGTLRAALVRYLVVGLLTCLCLQLIYWFQIGSWRPEFLSWPFLWAYSQNTMIDLLVNETSWAVEALIWATAYLLVGALLWVVIEVRGFKSPSTSWKRPVFSWLLVQVAVGILAHILFMGDVIRME